MKEKRRKLFSRSLFCCIPRETEQKETARLLNAKEINSLSGDYVQTMKCENIKTAYYLMRFRGIFIGLCVSSVSV